jgi:hypothetical protein
MREREKHTVANIRLPGDVTCHQVSLICDSKTDDLQRQHFKYNTVIP